MHDQDHGKSNYHFRFRAKARLDPSQVKDLRVGKDPGSKARAAGYDAPTAYNRGHTGHAKVLDPGNYGNEGPYAPGLVSRKRPKRPKNG